MKRVLVKSVFDAFEYVMQHFYPFGQKEMAEAHDALTDTYAVISIQDTHTQGFGFQFNENQFCKGVLTLYFDDIICEVDGTVLFTDDMADQIIDFIESHRKSVDTLLVHAMADSHDHEQLELSQSICLVGITLGTLRPVALTNMSMMF